MALHTLAYSVTVMTCPIVAKGKIAMARPKLARIFAGTSVDGLCSVEALSMEGLEKR
jgi:hypothetical protein